MLLYDGAWSQSMSNMNAKHNAAFPIVGERMVYVCLIQCLTLHKGFLSQKKYSFIVEEQ